MYLVDTNIFLELLLEREKADEVYKFFRKTDARSIYISEFSLYSIGILLLKLRKYELFRLWINDIVQAGVKIVKLDINDYESLIKVAEEFGLDFDDAYQYTLAEKYDLQIISFDSDFDRTKRKRKEPKEVI